MPDYRKLYFYLFGEMASAAEELEQGNPGLALNRLIAAQREAEERAVGEDAFGTDRPGKA